MIDLYTWSTPNGRKVSIMLEECGLPYTTHAIDIGKGDQFKPEFLKISPNNRIPAIVDRDTGLSLFESGAILMYLAQKTGKFWPKSGEAHWRTVEWLMWQMGGVGPDVRPGASLREVQQGQGALRRGALPERGAPALRRAGPAPGRDGVSRPATIRSPIWQPGRGCRASSGRRSTSASTRTCCAGTRRSRRGRPCRRAITCPSRNPEFQCRRKRRRLRRGTRHG